MEIIPVGTVAILTNFDKSSESIIDDDLAIEISDKLSDIIFQKFKEQNNDYELAILSVETKIGCIITTISLGVAISTIGFGIYTFIKITIRLGII